MNMFRWKHWQGSPYTFFGTLLMVFAVGLRCHGQENSRSKAPPKDLRPHLADYDAEPRLASGRMDLEQLVARLKELGATTYYFLILHAATDWDDLKLFLPLAERNHIVVWVYLVPPSESPPLEGNLYSEPFRLDYPRWAEEIARLSLQHTNLTAWVIDDFFVNHQLFTPAYIGAMQKRAKQINPRLQFLPLMYFYELRPSFAEDYHDVIDGTVVAYPPAVAEIERAHAILNDLPVARRSELSFPSSTTSKPGDFVSVSQHCAPTPAERAMIRFREREDYTGPTSGYHFKQLLVGGKVVWEEDVAGGTNGWREVRVKLERLTAAETNVALAFRLFDKQGVGNFPVRWELADLRVDGLELGAPLSQPERWELKQQGAFEAGFGQSLGKKTGRWQVPFIVMTAGQTIEFRLRHGDPASPERMAEWLKMCVQCLREGKCDGVVTYCLDKGKGSRIFDLSRDVFADYRRELK